MNFIGEEFSTLDDDERKFADNYESSCGPFARRAALFHTLQYLLYVKDKINNLPSQRKTLSIHDVKEIRHEDSAAYLSKLFSKYYNEIVAGKSEGEKMNERDIFEMVYSVFQPEILTALAFLFIDSFCRLGFSIIIFYLFEAVTEFNISLAYIHTAILVILWYLSLLLRHACLLLVEVTMNRLKAGFVMLLYSKVSKLTAYSIKSAELGKITNLIANDLGIFSLRMIYLVFATNFPILCIGLAILLVIRIGWAGLISIAIVLLYLPFSNLISETNSKYIEEINVFKDRRMKLTTQIIEGIKYVKLYGWETAFKRIIKGIRQQQVACCKKLAFGRAIERSFGNSISFVSSLIMLYVAFLSGSELTYAKIFSTLEIVVCLKFYTHLLVMGVGVFYEAKVVFQRFANIFNLENKSMIQIDRVTKRPIDKAQQAKGKMIAEGSQRRYTNKVRSTQLFDLRPGDIRFDRFDGYWSDDFQTADLKNINYHFRSKCLYGISGKVGSGKSGLLSAILGEIPFYSGKLEVSGSIAYVEQEPIIFSDTVRNNIIYGKRFSKDNYDEAVRLSCLASDFEILEKGDETMVGEKGTTLSGGQKARLALARAIYAGSEIYLLDDPISAVDAKVAKQLFQQCLKPLSQSKTVILVTHQISYLHECDQVIILEGGTIVTRGPPSSVTAKLDELSHKIADNDDEEPDETLSQKQKEGVPLEAHQFSSGWDAESNLNEKQSLKSEKGEAQRFIEKDVDVSFSSYSKFFMANRSNYILVPIFLLIFVLSEGIVTVYYRFLAEFDQVKAGNSIHFGGDFRSFWLILALLVFFYFLSLLFKYFVINYSILISSQSVHENMIEAIVRSPSHFFDSTPSGILINKFSNDLGIIDNNLVVGCNDVLQYTAVISVALLNLCQINPAMIIVIVAVFSLAIYFFFYSRPVIIRTKELDLQAKNPLFHYFGETISGLIQIRVYGQRMGRIRQMSAIINKATKGSISGDVTTRGFAFTESVIGVLFMLLGMVLCLYLLDPHKTNLYAVTVVYFITISEGVQWLLRQFIVTEGLMVSAERILRFSLFQHEAELRLPYDREIGLNHQLDAVENGEEIHQQWPENNKLEFRNLSARYKARLPLILKDISFIAGMGEKVGIVGRTGAGKSSVIQALFRIFEPERGSVYRVDQYDALKMGLHSLRQHISVIPQVPFLFNGSVKQNIDPFGSASDDQIWRVLEESGLKPHVQSLEKQLQTVVSNASESFSVGQKQLLCLARALLRRNKFLVLDEATSNVDMKTDAFIQNIIRQRFTDTTVVTIAHRLNTIADYDKIIVMHRGRIVEMGSPFELLEKKGLFFEMVQHTGKNAELIKSRAKNSYRSKKGIR